MKENHFSFLAIGKTEETKEASESNFKRYIGWAPSSILAVNPTKEELEKIYGRPQEKDPDYVVEDERRGKGLRLDIFVKPEVEGVDLIAKAQFRLFYGVQYNKDETKVRILDMYGNSTWMDKEAAKAGQKPLTSSGELPKIDQKYRIALMGEAEITDFLRHFVFNKDSFRMENGVWMKQEDADDVKIQLDKFQELCKGDLSDVKEAIAMQPNNRIMLLYGVRSHEGKFYQEVCTGYDMFARISSGSRAIPRLEKNLANAKNAGLYANTEYKVQDLQEYTVEPTNLDKPAASSSAQDAMPW